MKDNNVTPISDATKQRVLADTLTNFVANMNTGNDKRRHSQFTGKGRLDRTQLEALYREDWIAGKIIDIIPDEMTREWRKFISPDLDGDAIEELQKAEGSLRIKYLFNEAKKWARLYGGALIVMNIEGTGEPHEPLNIEQVKEGSLKSLQVYDAENAQFVKINNTDPFADNFLKPETYRLARTSVEIHHSRVLRFDGQLLPFNELQRNRYWHDSILGRVYEALINANIANDSSASLLFETNVDVIKVKNLMTMLSSTEGEKALTDRFFLAKILKANNNITLLDSEEEFEKHSVTFSGIPDMLDRFMTIISAASDIPATRLFGKSAQGLNATGEGDLINFYDHVKEKQGFEFTPLLDQLDPILARHLNVDPEAMEYIFSPLWQITDKDQAEIKLKGAQADQIYIDTGAIKVSTVSKQLQQEGTYSNITTEDIEEIEAFENEEPDEGDKTIEKEEKLNMIQELESLSEEELKARGLTKEDVDKMKLEVSEPEEPEEQE